MRDALFQVERTQPLTLQAQIRNALISAVSSGQLDSGEPVPSTRAMARRIGVSRNTVVLAYQALVDDGFLLSRERSGFYVNDDMVRDNLSFTTTGNDMQGSIVDWGARFAINPGGQDNIQRPITWRNYPYPFIYGQSDPALFPISEWRECSRQALGRRWLEDWTSDLYAADDPMLIQEIRKRILPRRGISADDEQILITMGAQNAIYLLASLLVKPDTRIAFEEPGYPDARNIFRLKTKSIHPASVDEYGIKDGPDLNDSDIIFVTPSHQYPTAVTMSPERRKSLLDIASKQDAIIIEDDYEFETSYVSEPVPALKSQDKDGRVIYIGSLSKSLVPGLRIGFLVAPRKLVEELRALRKLMLRHPPGNNQRTVAMFLANGHHDMLVHRIHRSYRERWKIMGEALNTHLPGWSKMPSFGGSSYWLTGPPELDANKLAEAALEQGVVIEPGAVFYATQPGPTNNFRLGFSQVSAERIELGIERLAGVIRELLDGSLSGGKK